MFLRVDYKSGIPVYQQLVEQVKAAAATGRIGPGEALPSVRVLAEELRINRNTVARAYLALESEGVIETRPGSGCFIRPGGTPTLRKSARNERLARGLDALVFQAHHLQVPDDELIDLLRERLADFHRTREAREPSVS